MQNKLEWQKNPRDLANLCLLVIVAVLKTPPLQTLQLGFDVALAGNGEECLAKLQMGGADLVLLVRAGSKL